jgi:hypothetical protein
VPSLEASASIVVPDHRFQRSVGSPKQGDETDILQTRPIRARVPRWETIGMSHRVMFGLGVLVWLFLSACKPDDDKSDDESVPEDQFASRYAEIQCGSLSGCCQAAHFTFDSKSCRSRQTAKIQKDIDEQSKLAVVYDADAAGQCLSALKDAVYCGMPSEKPEVCKRIFSGTLAMGESCHTVDECIPPGHCQADASGTRVCQPDSAPAIAHGREGDSCETDCLEPGDCIVPPDTDVTAPDFIGCYRSDGLYCNGTCRRILAVGDACDRDDLCQPGLFCDRMAGVLPDAGHCTAPYPAGARCQSDDQCQTYCDGEVCGQPVGEEQCAFGLLE